MPSEGRARPTTPPIVTLSNTSARFDGSHVIDIPDDIPDPSHSWWTPTEQRARTDLLRGAGVLAGHTLHQIVGTGLATYAREALSIAITTALRSQPGLALGLHTSMFLVNLATEAVRTHQLARDPDEAARGFHALTTEQWNARSPEQQQAMRERQQRHARAVLGMHVFGQIVSLGFGVQGFHNGNDIQTANALAQNVKNTFYAAARDGLQASFSMVGLRGNPNSAGNTDDHFSTAAGRYGMTQAGANAVGNMLMGVMAPGIAPSGGYIMGVPAETEAMTHAMNTLSQTNPFNRIPILLGAACRVSGVRAINNTWPEIFDWFQLMRHEAIAAGTSQEWNPRLTGASPSPNAHRDYARMLDQSTTRAAGLHATTAVASLVNLIPHEGVRTMLGNIGIPVFIALIYKTIGQDWQAEGAVRASVAARARARAEAEGASTSGS